MIKPSIEHALTLAYGTLPLYVYRGFDQRLKLEQTEDDDIEHELYAEVTSPTMIRLFYYGEDGLEQSLHGGAKPTSEFTVDTLRKWFIGMVGAEQWKVGGPLFVKGMNKAMDLIFSTLPKRMIIHDQESVLNVLVTGNGANPPYDIRYFDAEKQEHHFTDGDLLNVPMADLTAKILLKDLEDSRF